MQCIETRIEQTGEVVKGCGLNEIHCLSTEVIGDLGVEREGRLCGEGERERGRERERE